MKTRSIRFKTQYDINEIKFYCNIKDKTAALCNSFIVYGFYCPGCDANYIGKTEKTCQRTVKHAWTDNNSAVIVTSQRLHRCITFV